jgi:LAO/AO transport system kinase
MPRRPESSQSAPDVAKLAAGIRAGERAVLARAITLIESKRADHQRAARKLVQELLPATGGASRVDAAMLAPEMAKEIGSDVVNLF